MYRTLRTLHKVAGLVGSLFLILIAVTGFLLAIKSSQPSIRPPTLRGGEVGSLREVVHPSQALGAAIMVGLPELRSPDDVERFEYHMGKNVYKVLSAEGYHEVQVDGATGRVLGVALRNDQRIEDLHDLSAFHPSLRTVLLPAIAVILFLLGVSGVVMYFVPVVRRMKYRARNA